MYIYIYIYIADALASGPSRVRGSAYLKSERANVLLKAPEHS